MWTAGSPGDLFATTEESLLGCTEKRSHFTLQDPNDLRFTELRPSHANSGVRPSPSNLSCRARKEAYECPQEILRSSP